MLILHSPEVAAFDHLPILHLSKKRRPTKAQRKARRNDVENKIAAIDALLQSESSAMRTPGHANTQDMQLAVAKQSGHHPNIYETMFKQMADEHPGFVHKYIPALPAINRPLSRNQIQEHRIRDAPQPVQRRKAESPAGVGQNLLSLAKTIFTPTAATPPASISSTASTSNMQPTAVTNYLLKGIRVEPDDFEVEFYQEEYSEIMDELFSSMDSKGGTKVTNHFHFHFHPQSHVSR